MNRDSCHETKGTGGSEEEELMKFVNLLLQSFVQLHHTACKLKSLSKFKCLNFESNTKKSVEAEACKLARFILATQNQK